MGAPLDEETDLGDANIGVGNAVAACSDWFFKEVCDAAEFCEELACEGKSAVGVDFFVGKCKCRHWQPVG